MGRQLVDTVPKKFLFIEGGRGWAGERAERKFKLVAAKKPLKPLFSSLIIRTA